MKKKVFLKFEIFKEIIPPRHIKRIDFAHCNKSVMPDKILSTDLEQFLRRLKSPLTR